MKVGDLIRNTRHPQAGLGIVVVVGAPGGYDQDLEPDYVIAVWPDNGEEIAYVDEIEMLGELSDEQLEHVCGGMSRSKFDAWRCNQINGAHNESR